MKKNLQTQGQSILNWIKKHFIVIISLIILIFVVIHYNSCKPGSIAITSDPAKLQPVETYKDKSGITHAVIPTNVVSKAIMEYRLDSLRRALKASYINQLTTIASQVDTVFKDRYIVKNDTTGEFSVSFSDPYLESTTTGNIKTGKADIKVRLIDTITYVDYTKKRFLRANLRNIDISNKNPYNKIVAGSNITLKQPKVIVAIGPSFSYGLAFTPGKPTFVPMVGISATLNVINFKAK